MPSLAHEIHRDIVRARRESRLHENILRLQRDPEFLAMVGVRTMMSAEQVQTAVKRYYEGRLAETWIKWDPQLTELGSIKKKQTWEQATKRNIFLDWLL